MSDNRNRNKLCHCGSGRKFKRCHGQSQSRRRSHRIQWDYGRAELIDMIAFNTETGEIKTSLRGKPVHVASHVVETGYEGETKFKVLNRMPIVHGAISSNPNVQLAKSFDRLIAVDTNTYPLGESEHSVSTTCVWLAALKPDGVTLQYGPMYAFALWNVKGKPENLAWQVVIELVQRNPEVSEKNLRIGLIVDSDLGNLDTYNSGTPIYGNFVLPPNVHLVHASDRGGGNEYIANRLLRSVEKRRQKSVGVDRRERKRSTRAGITSRGRALYTRSVVVSR